MKCIHFLCRDNLNVHRVPSEPGSVYTTGNWKVSEAEAAELVGGMLYLHQTKNTKSRFGGRIRGYSVIPAEHRDAGRIVFTFESLPDAKDIPWSTKGQTHGRAFTSGVVDCP